MLTCTNWNMESSCFFEKDIYHRFTLKATLKDTNCLREEHAKTRQLKDTGYKINVISCNFQDISFFIYTITHEHFNNIIAYCMSLYSNVFLRGFELSYSASHKGILRPKWLDILQVVWFFCCCYCWVFGFMFFLGV